MTNAFRSQGRLADIMAHSPAVAVAWADIRRERVLFVSDNAGRLGLDAEALLSGSLSLVERIHPEDAPRVRALTEQALALGRSELRLEYRLVTPDGRIVRVEELSRFECGSGCARLEGLLLDVSTREAHGYGARPQPERSQLAVVDDLSEFVGRFLADGTITFVNDAHCRFFGVPREFLLGQNLFALVPAPESTWLQDHLSTLTPQQPASRTRRVIPMPNGGERWVEWVERAFFDSEGKVQEYQSVGRDVTAEVTSRKELNEANTLLTAIVESVPTPVYIRDTEHRYRIMNPAYARFWGLEPSDCLGKTPHEFLPREAADIIVAGDQAVLSTLRPQEAEEPFYPNGEERILWSREVPLCDKDGKPWGICGVVMDITERQRMESELEDARQGLEVRVAERTRQLREANRRLSREIAERLAAEREQRLRQEQLRIILDNLPSHVYVRDAQGRYLLMNRQYERFWGLDSGSALGRTPYDVLPAKVAEKILADDELILSEGRPLTLDETFQRAGRLHTFLTCEVPLLDSQGRAYAVCGVCTDVSERKRMEAALGESERTLRGLIDAIGQSLVLLDPTGRLLAINKTCLGRMGYSEAEEVLGTCHFDHMTSEEAAQRRAMLERVLSSRRPCHERMHFRSALHKTSFYPFFDEAGQVSSVAIYSEDITHEVNLERQLRRAQRLEAVGTLASGIAHEFNNMLTLIMGFGEMALETSHEKSDCLLQVLRTAERGRDIVRQMLTFSRGDDQPRIPLDIGSTARECLDLLRATLPRDVRLESSLPERPLCVLANATQIHQLLINLVSNAADAMRGQDPTGGIIRVELAHCPEDKSRTDPSRLLPGEHARLSVSDTGPGMAADVLERIFDPFFTTKEPGKGTGLGLAVVHGIVQAMDGVIMAASKPGQGACFDILLPLATVGFSEPGQP
ncbi:PAS domain-containing protein [Desulfocurvibacter africanus]|uniref:histidine kinase n=1 Tax=Desulfocurvibacter africanus subsp. africanus str. Walvis Bay TaxID=690850 RepID=F3YU52_DESAF|nr:PAS domain-containing protein [Desulfocurvibacter africanus]EGJ48658.1 PAS/PAC sensor signal transduction histidine kinase [Desulfocurvibacter africanus subsp. africanus str. Walvis Bay]